MFDFLFSNPIVIIILIGVISSILKKKNKPKQQEFGKPQAPKQIWQEVIREIKDEWLEEKTTTKPIQEAKSVRPAEKTESNEETEGKRMDELKRLQQEYEEKREQEVKREPRTHTIFPAPVVVAITPSTRMISDEGSPVYNKDLSFGKKELINGIIMSEVLGLPRAKRSLQQSRR